MCALERVSGQLPVQPQITCLAGLRIGKNARVEHADMRSCQRVLPLIPGSMARLDGCRLANVT